MGLDKFLAKHTSEDNASFREILEESEQRKRDKQAWLFEKEGQQDKVIVISFLRPVRSNIYVDLNDVNDVRHTDDSKVNRENVISKPGCLKKKGSKIR